MKGNYEQEESYKKDFYSYFCYFINIHVTFLNCCFRRRYESTELNIGPMSY